MTEHTIKEKLKNPPKALGVELVYTNNVHEAETWLRTHITDRSATAVGFDMEWKPQTVRKECGGTENKTAVLQLAVDTSCLVLHIYHMEKLPDLLVSILKDATVEKIGSAIKDDMSRLERERGLVCCGFVDTQVMAKSLDPSSSEVGLKALAKRYLGIEVPKNKSRSNWEKIPLDFEQRRYAALDAWYGLKVYEMKQRIESKGPERECGDRDRSNEPDRTDSDWRSKPDPPPTQNGNNDRYNDDGGSRDRWGPRGDDGGPRDRSGYRGYDDGPSWDRSGGRERGYDDGPRGYQERRGDDRYGDRDRGKGFGSNWDSGDRDRRDDRGQDRYDSGRDRPDDRRYGDRYGGDRDRGGGYGRDRYDDRRGGDRYGGYGRDRYDDRRGGDRYDDRRGGDRYDDRRGGDRFDDRRGGDRYGDRDRRRDYDDRERSSWRDSDRGRDSRSDFDRDEREPVRERPRLQLQPRTKPVEETKGETAADNSVFGGAKPVDTAAKEREIEEKLARQKLEDEAKLKQEKERQRERRERDEWPRGSSGRARRDSNRSSDGERGGKDRRDNPDFRSRRDSARSSDEGTPSKDAEPTSRENSQGGGKEVKAAVKEAPKDAPPPAVNVWAQRMEQQKAASTGTVEPKSPTGEHRVEINVDSSTMTVTSPTSPTSSDRKGFPSKPPGPRKDFREGGGPPKGRGTGTRPERGERSDRTDRGDRASVNGPDGGGRGVRKEKRERRPVESKKYEEAQQPVFHMKSKFAALLDDEEQSEQDTQEQLDVDDET